MNLEDKALLYSGNVGQELLGKIIFGLNAKYNPSELTVIRDKPESKGYSKHYSIYMPKEEYELNLGIC